MKHTRRVVCPTCNGNTELVDDDVPWGWRVCGECNGLGYKHVNAEAMCCDVQTREIEGPRAEPVDAR